MSYMYFINFFSAATPWILYLPNEKFKLTHKDAGRMSVSVVFLDS